MTIQNPQMLPKIRSEALLDAVRYMPCTLRIASFVPGRACSPQGTVVPCHLPTIGKGVASKVSDLFVAAGCQACHDIIDGRDIKARDYIEAKYPTALMERLLRGGHETQARWVQMGLLTGEDWRVV